MSWSTKYYYNLNKVQVTLKATGDKVYYIPGRNYSYIKEELANGFMVPKNVRVLDVPGWWREDMWPHTKPWMPQP